MATAKFKFRPSTVQGREGTLFLQVIHRRTVRQVCTSYKLYPHEWDAASQSVAVSEGDGGARSRYLQAVRETLCEDRMRLQLIILRLDHARREYRAEDVVRLFLRREQVRDFLEFAGMLVREKRAEGREALAEKYTLSINSFRRFVGRDAPQLVDMSAALMQRYEAFLRQRGLCANTISFYMRTLRAIYNQAVERGLTRQAMPFARVYTGVGRTAKRAVGAADVRKIREAKLPCGSAAALSRDLFLFSIYTCGMSMVDMAHLRRSDLSGGYIAYRRRKTGQQILVRWEPCMQEIVARYDTGSSPYLLPIITRPGADELRQYRSKMHLVNKHLGQLGRRLGLSQRLTTYVARHSWASIAKGLQVPVAAISEAMGHTSESTTRIYLKSFENAAADRANSAVLQGLMKRGMGR